MFREAAVLSWPGIYGFSVTLSLPPGELGLGLDVEWRIQSLHGFHLLNRDHR